MTVQYRLLHSPGFDPASLAAALAASGVSVGNVATPAELVVDEFPTAFVLDPASRHRFPVPALSRFVEAGGAVLLLGAPGERDLPDAVPLNLVAAFLPQSYGTRQLLLALRTAYAAAVATREARRARDEAASRTRELGELTRIGMALSTERDLDTLLDLILSQARELTNADAGSLYLVEHPDAGPRQLRFKLTQNFSRPEIPFVEVTIPLDTTSIAGYVATTAAPLVLDDAYQIPPGVEYSINRSFDEKYGYRTKSMLTIPMHDHRDQIIGVLQLINRKRNYGRRLETPADFADAVVSFDARTVELVSALAGQAAVSIENSELYASIERLFEGFVRAAVTAIEQRDPTTFGHSGRVAAMTVGLADAVNRAGDGAYRDVSFSREQLREIRYAGLLHDFGKVGVREQVLVKAKKLYAPDLTLIRQRYGFIRRTSERDYERQRAEYLERHGTSAYATFLEQLQREHDQRLAELDRFMTLVLQSNEPTVLPEGSFQELLDYADRCYEDVDGRDQPFLSDDEVRFLSIRKGSLDEQERLEIESHVSHTYRFLLQIPWTKEMQNVPHIAYGHHEKLDGSGYPRRVGAEQIPIQTRMMTVADIFDALTATDRPYKRAVPAPRALDIMAEEVRDGMLDAELFRLFTEARVFERAHEEG
jgi:HD-GYP domain-containing protein (c-di-GMP phosphodiesterase class II)